MHRITTENGLEMISALDNLTVYGGYDCPEYAMSGLLQGTTFTVNIWKSFKF